MSRKAKNKYDWTRPACQPASVFHSGHLKCLYMCKVKHLDTL